MGNVNNSYLYSSLTDEIIAAAFKVYNNLGAGFLEKVYENAMVIELLQQNMTVEQQFPIKVKYNDITVGDYYADL